MGTRTLSPVMFGCNLDLKTTRRRRMFKVLTPGFTVGDCSGDDELGQTAERVLPAHTGRPA